MQTVELYISNTRVDLFKDEYDSDASKVSFDMFSAKLVIEFIAGKDAPKPYPNFTLAASLTTDSIKDSNLF